MNQKTIYIILGAVLIIIAALLVFRGRTADAPADELATTTPTSTPIATASLELSNTTASTPSTPATGSQQMRGDLADGAYTLVTSESSIGWTGYKPRVLGYEDSGTLALSSGSVAVTNGAVSGGEFVIDMASLTADATTNTKAPLSALEGHLKSADFFDVETYPEARFVVKRMTNGTVTGDLTIKGITKTISFPATIDTDASGRLVADATITLNRSLWDIRYGSGSFFDNLGNNLIADEVAVTLHLVAAK